MVRTFDSLKEGMAAVMPLLPDSIRPQAAAMLARRPLGKTPLETLVHRFVRYVLWYNAQLRLLPRSGNRNYISINIHSSLLELSVNTPEWAVSIEIRSAVMSEPLTTGPYRFRVNSSLGQNEIKRDIVWEARCRALGWSDNPAIPGSRSVGEFPLSENT